MGRKTNKSKSPQQTPNLDYVICWVNVEIAFFVCLFWGPSFMYRAVKEKICRFLFWNKMQGAVVCVELIYVLLGRTFSPSPHQWTPSAQCEHLLPSLVWSWPETCCWWTGWAVVCSDPSVSDTPCYETLMNFNLYLQVWETNGTTVWSILNNILAAKFVVWDFLH